MGVILGRFARGQHEMVMADARRVEARLQGRQPARANIGVGDDEGGGAGRQSGQLFAGMGDEIGADQDVIGARAKFDMHARGVGGEGQRGHVRLEFSLCGQMALQRIQDFLDDRLMRRIARLDRHVGLGIDGITVVDQAAHGAFGIGGLQQRPRRALADPAHQHLELRLEPDRHGVSANQFTGMGIDEGAAAGGDDALALPDQTRQNAPFAVAEIGFSVRGENLGYGQTMGGFDFMIGIDERQAEPLGEPFADRRLARAHHADEDERAPGQYRHDRLRARIARGRRQALLLFGKDSLRHNGHVLSRSKGEM